MPDPVTHYVFGRQVLTRLPEDIRGSLELPLFERSVQGPDPWSVIGFYGGRNKQFAGRSAVMHKSRTGQFMAALAKEAKQDMSIPVFSVLAGVICHYCLDRLTHPYIICKGGDYDGTEQTREQKGGHVRLERAIDSYYIRQVYGKTPWHFSVPRQTMPPIRLPESLRPALNRVYRQVYGWENVFDLLNASLRDERLFYGLMQDPLGIVHLLLRPISSGKTNYCIYSYYRREADSRAVDYLNEQRRPWSHPFAPERVSTDSFPDLFDRALEEAVEMIRAVYRWIGGNPEICLEEVLGNSDYSTGLDCGDPGNLRKPVCEPLRYRGKYWN